MRKRFFSVFCIHSDSSHFAKILRKKNEKSQKICIQDGISIPEKSISKQSKENGKYFLVEEK